MVVTTESPRPVVRVPSDAVVLALAGVGFVVYPVLRPYGDGAPEGAAAAFASSAWVASHLAAVAAFVLVGLALRRYGRTVEVTWWVGAGLVLPYYGAEVFALHALGSRMGGDELAATAEAIRLGAAAATVFAAGLVAFAVVGVLVLVRDRLVALPFMLGLVLFLPQFFAPPAVRIAHGVLLGAGCVLLAARQSRQRVSPSPESSA